MTSILAHVTLYYHSTDSIHSPKELPVIVVPFDGVQLVFCELVPTLQRNVSTSLYDGWYQ